MKTAITKINAGIAALISSATNEGRRARFVLSFRLPTNRLAVVALCLSGCASPAHKGIASIGTRSAYTIAHEASRTANSVMRFSDRYIADVRLGIFTIGPASFTIMAIDNRPLVMK